MATRCFLVEECQAQPAQAETSKSQNSSSEEEFDPQRLEEPLPGQKLCAKNWFLTFPKTDTTKEEALARLQAKHKESLLGVLVAQEQHKDGECSPDGGLALGAYPFYSQLYLTLTPQARIIFMS